MARATKRRLHKARRIPPRRTRQRPSYGFAIAWPIVVCVSIHAQAAVLVWNGPASECSARPRDTPTKKHGTSCAPTRLLIQDECDEHLVSHCVLSKLLAQPLHRSPVPDLVCPDLPDENWQRKPRTCARGFKW